jgi:transposase InsO family protein
MKDYSLEFSVEKMAKVLGVSRSGYYAWNMRSESTRRQNRIHFDIEVKAAFEDSNGTYGSVRLTKELVKKGYGKNRKRVLESMVRQQLQSKRHRKFRVCTTDSKHSYTVSDNIINRNFSPEKKNQVWVTDITYLKSNDGWLYLTVFIDLFSRMIVGWSLSDNLGHESVVKALQRGLWRRKPAEGLIIHSDRGIQYCCEGFRTVTKKHKIIQSMSRKGNCWDNVVAESFFKTLKSELIYHVNLLDLNHAQHVLFDYIEGFYNCKRIHSTLGDLSPIEFEDVKKRNVA